MIGFKERAFAPVVAVSLEELVPADHFYRQLQHVLDLSFVYDLVRESYAAAGRPSIDPVVFFKLQLVMFFEDIRSERLLMRLVADRLSVRWYLGYDLDDPLPDHSSLSRIRARYGLEIFRRFFDAVLEQCQRANLIWGKELYIDATKVDANASVDSLATRFAVEARQAFHKHLQDLFQEENDQSLPEPAPAAPQTNAQPTPCQMPCQKKSEKRSLSSRRVVTIGIHQEGRSNARGAACTSIINAGPISGSAPRTRTRLPCVMAGDRFIWAIKPTTSSMEESSA